MIDQRLQLCLNLLASAQQIADARLGHVQELGSLRLRHSAGSERFLELEQQVGTNQQMRRFL